MYRPTVRYADAYREYVDRVFQATSLDRNQIIRLALFTAAHSQQFRNILVGSKKPDVPLPSPGWSPTDHRLWREQCPKIKEEGRDVNAQFSAGREATPATRSNPRSGVAKTGRGKDVSRDSKEGRLRSIRAGQGIKIQIG